MKKKLKKKISVEFLTKYSEKILGNLFLIEIYKKKSGEFSRKRNSEKKI